MCALVSTVTILAIYKNTKNNLLSFKGKQKRYQMVIIGIKDGPFPFITIASYLLLFMSLPVKAKVMHGPGPERVKEMASVCLRAGNRTEEAETKAGGAAEHGSRI